MRRSTNKFILFMVGAVLFASNSFAGINYIEYRKNLQTEKKEIKSSPEEKRFQRTNEHFREQQEKVVTPSKECNRNRIAHKYDRCNWDPTR